MEAFIGLDLSLNHWAMVVQLPGWEIGDEESILGYFVTNVKKFTTTNSTATAHYLTKKAKGMDKDNYQIRRIQESLDHLLASLDDITVKNKQALTLYVAMEGYSYQSVSSSSAQSAELAGHVKMNLFSRWNASLPTYLRIHDPRSVKMFGTGNGNATKRMMYKEFSVSAPPVVQSLVPPALFVEKKKDIDGPGTDLVDAYYLSQMCKVEHFVRQGVYTLEKLPEAQRRIFLRVTKTNPVNLLARQYITV